MLAMSSCSSDCPYGLATINQGISISSPEVPRRTRHYGEHGSPTSAYLGAWNNSAELTSRNRQREWRVVLADAPINTVRTFDVVADRRDHHDVPRTADQRSDHDDVNHHDVDHDYDHDHDYADHHDDTRASATDSRELLLRPGCDGPQRRAKVPARIHRASGAQRAYRRAQRPLVIRTH